MRPPEADSIPSQSPLELAPLSADELAAARVSQDEELFRLLVDNAQDFAIIMLDVHGKVSSWNRAAERLKGYRAEEIIGRDFRTFYTLEDLALGKPEIELRVAEIENRYEDEGWRVRRDGSRFWASVVVTALRDSSGILRGFGKLTRDVTGRKVAEMALRDSEERYRLLVDSVRDYAIFLLTPTGRIASWNAGAQRIKGYSREEILGRHFSIFYPKEDIDTGKAERELHIAAEAGRYEEEGWRVRKDGSRFWASVVLTAVRDGAGVLTGYSKVTRDLTDRRRTEEALRRSRENLLRSNRELEQFASIASHDLQEPLRKIQSFGDQLRIECSDALSDDGKFYLERMRASATRMRRLIDDLLELSRVTSRERPFTSVDLGEILAGVTGDLESRIKESNGDLVVGPMARIEADPMQMRQLLQNLLSNAFKFRKPDVTPVVRVSSIYREVDPQTDGELLAARGGRVCDIVVEDNGIGFDEKYKDRMFKLFQRLHGRSEYEGTGLGLSICARIAERHGGHIRASSTVGQGSRFVVTLPELPPKREEIDVSEELQ